MKFNEFWKKGVTLPGLADSYGGFGKKFKLKIDGPFLTSDQVRTRANQLRKLVQAQHPGMYDMQVTVRDRNDGQFKSAGFHNTSKKDFRVWSPEDYESEYETKTNHKGLGLQADQVFIVFYRN